MKQTYVGLGVLGSLVVYNLLIVPMLFSETTGGGINWSRAVGAGVAASLGVILGNIIYRATSKNKDS
jgi:hypothetical protein